jgi:ubiquitin-like protein Pup
MAAQKQSKKESAEEEVVETPAPVEKDTKLSDEIDDLLEEIDDVLESDAESFVRDYVQKGGQ